MVPAASQICKALRHEVLSICYSINTFELGRVPFRDLDFKSVHSFTTWITTVQRWRDLLAQSLPACHISAGTLEVVLNVRHETELGCFHDRVFQFTAERDQRGRFALRLTNEAKMYCVCGLLGDDEESQDGWSLVDAAPRICQRCWPSVRAGCCDGCGSASLV